MPAPGRPRTVDPADLAESALGLFRSKGYGATTMDDVAAAAGVSRTTLFRYFPRKADLLWARQDDWAADFTARMADQPPTSSDAQAVVDAFIAGFDPASPPRPGTSCGRSPIWRRSARRGRCTRHGESW